MTIATPNNQIVSSSGAPIKTKNTTTTEGKKVSEDEAKAKLAVSTS